MGEADSEVCGAVLSEGLIEFEKPMVAPLDCENKNVVGGSESELYSLKKADDLLAHIDIEGFMHNQTCERQKNNVLESLAEGKGNDDPNFHGLEQCSTNEVKEVSNDDMFSEVSNPKFSPWDHTSSFQTMSSSLVECTMNTEVVCAEITSCSGREESLDMENPTSNEASGPVTATRIVLEIPKEFSTTGVRRITLKFRESNESSGVDVEFNSSTTKELYQTGNPCLHPPNMGLKMTKNVVPDIYPTNVKKLLSTKILEGAHVKYISTSGQKQLSGIVKDSGYLCGCSFCNFSKVLSAYEFELHAGGKTRHPHNHIYLENGKPIYSIIYELKTTPLDLIDQMLKDVAGSSVNEQNLKTWKGTLLQSCDGVGSNRFYHGNSPGIFHSTKSQWTKDCISAQNSCTDEFFLNQHTIMDMPEEQKHVRKKARYFTGSVTEQKKTSEGGPKKRDNDLHRLLFMPNGLPDGTDLGYYSKGKKILEGYKHGNGILCSCCHTEISPSQFEAHAGWAAKRQPYRHIFTSNGLTLHDIALMLARGQSVATNSSNDVCSVCGDRGELIMCNGCPQAFHAACLCVVGVDYAPSSNWLCPHCQPGPRRNGRNTNAESRPIIIRLTRVVKAPSYECGGCVVCRIPDFSPETFDDRTVMLCDQCEKEYHVGCLRKIGLCDLKELPTEKWFCCCECNTIYLALQNCVMKGSEVVNPSVSATIAKKHLERGLSDGDTSDIQWRILSGKSRYSEHLPLLSKAAAIFRECFDPIVAKTGRDLIPVMVYGRNISGQEFGGMYCVVLLIKSVAVSAGLLRVFGQEVAELPLVATSREYQGRGYFQALFACIERLLHSMHVKNLVLPAAEEAESIWTKKLGFRKMPDEQYLRYSRDLQLTVFKGTSMLVKEMQPANQAYDAL